MTILQKYGALVGLFLVSFTLLQVQILLLRFSRVAFAFGAEFMILSLAILGVGLGGLVVYWLFNKSLQWRRILFWFSLIYASFSLIPFLILHLSNFQPVVLVSGLFFASELITYTAAGIMIALTFRYQGSNPLVIYAVNLLGSAAGSLFVIQLLNQAGPAATQVNFILTGLASAVYLIQIRVPWRPVVLMATLSLVVLIGYLSNSLTRVVCYPNHKLVSSWVNSFSQIDTYDGTGGDSGGYDITIDCVWALATVYPHSPESTDTIGKLPFRLHSYQDVLVIGSAGGTEVAEAIRGGARSVTAVEINPLVIKAVYQANPNTIYHNKNVNLRIQEGRDYIATSTHRFDLIYLPTSKFFGNLGLFTFALQENYLYTKESMKSYLTHLSHAGVLAIKDHYQETDQFFLTLGQAISELGGSPNDAIRVGGSKPYDLILYQRGGFSQSDLSKLGVGGRSGLSLLTKPASSDLLVLTFDRPYLTHALGPTNVIWETSRPQALVQLLGLILLVAAVFFLALWLFLKKRLGVPASQLGLFSFTGVGFIGVELYLVEKTSLLLGHPEFAVEVALTTILVFSGLGSLLITRRSIDPAKLATVTILSLLFYIGLFEPLVSLLAPAALGLRFLMTFLILGLPSLGIGVLFAAGIRKVQSVAPRNVPIMLAVDGLATVIGGLLFKVISLNYGFTAGLGMAVLAYLLALLCFRSVREQ